MKKNNLFYLLAFLLLCPTLSWAQKKGEKFFPIKQNNQWGLIDAKGKVVMTPKYEYISNFDANGFAIIKKDGLKGIINEEGKEIVAPKHDNIKALTSKAFAFYKNGKWGAMNLQSKVVLPAEYDNVFPMNKNIFGIFANNLYGFANAEGKLIVSANYDQVDFFSENVPVVRVYSKRLQGLLNLEGEEIVPVKQDKVEVKEGMALCTEKGSLITEVRFDKMGKLIDRQQYSSLRKYQESKKKEKDNVVKPPVSNDIRWTQKGRFWVLLDEDGQVILDRKLYTVNADPESGITLGRGTFENPEKDPTKREYDKELCVVIDHNKAKVLFSKVCYDLYHTDYAQSNYARISVDTLWDGLISKQGKLLTTLDDNGTEIEIENIYNFSGGFASVKAKNGKFGAIDKDANVVVSFEYDFLSDFSEGFTVGRKDGKFGALNSAGKTVIPFEYDGSSAYSNGLFRVKRGRGRAGLWGCVDSNNKTVVPFDYNLIGTFVNGEAKVLQLKDNKPYWGYVNNKGKLVIPVKVQCDMVEDFKDGLALIYNGRKVDRSKQYPVVSYDSKGYINRKGEYVVNPKYDFIKDFPTIFKEQKGLTQVKKKGKIGFIDYKGQEVLAPKYDFVGDYPKIWQENKGVCRVVLDKSEGYINHFGQEVVAPKYDKIYNFPDVFAAQKGMAKVRSNKKYGYINHKGEEVILPSYESLSEPKNGVIIAGLAGQKGLISTKGEKIEDIKHKNIFFFLGEGANTVCYKNTKKKYLYYDKEGKLSYSKIADEMGTLSEGVVAFKEGKLWGFMNTEDKVIIKPQYEAVGDFHDGLAPFYQKGKWGYLDKTGKVAITPQFAAANNFSNGLAYVSFGKNKNNFIDTKGKTILPSSGGLQSEGFKGGVAICKKGTLYGVIDPKGNWIVDATMKSISEFDDKGYAIVNTKGKTYGCINKAGKMVIKAKFKMILPFSGDVATAQLSDGWNLIDRKGKSLLKTSYRKIGPFRDGLASFQDKGKFGYLDQTGKIVIPAKYKQAQEFGEGLAVVNGNQIINKKGEHVAYIKIAGEIVSPFNEGRAIIKMPQGFSFIGTDGQIINGTNFDQVTEFTNGLCFVQKGEKWILTRQKGEGPNAQVSNISFTRPQRLNYIKGPTKTLMEHKTNDGQKVKDLKWTKVKEGKWKRMDKDGNLVDKEALYSYEYLADGTLKIVIENVYGIMKFDGTKVTEAQYGRIKRMAPNVYRVADGDKIGYINAAGEWIWKPQN